MYVCRQHRRDKDLRASETHCFLAHRWWCWCWWRWHAHTSCSRLILCWIRKRHHSDAIMCMHVWCLRLCLYVFVCVCLCVAVANAAATHNGCNYPSAAGAAKRHARNESHRNAACKSFATANHINIISININMMDAPPRMRFVTCLCSKNEKNEINNPTFSKASQSTKLCSRFLAAHNTQSTYINICMSGTDVRCKRTILVLSVFFAELFCDVMKIY